MRLVSDPSAELTFWERGYAQNFVDRQEERFEQAKTRIIRTGDDLAFVGDGLLEFGDVSDFCGLVLDRVPARPSSPLYRQRRAVTLGPFASQPRRPRR